MVGRYCDQVRSRDPPQSRALSPNTFDFPSSAKKGQWIAQISRELGCPQYIGKNYETVHILGDNQGDLGLVKSPNLHERSKHIDINHHHVRDLFEKPKLEVICISTIDMVVEGLMKLMQKIMFGKFKSQLGIFAS